MADLTRRAALRGVLGLGAAAGAMSAAGCATTGASAPAAPAGTRFLHGVASGDPRPDSVILWTRVSPPAGHGGPVGVRWTVRGENGQAVRSGLAQTGPARDYTVKVEAAGLRPGTAYTYGFDTVAGERAVASPEGRTRTAPAPGAQTPVRLALVSCSNYQFGFFNAYGDLAARAERPDAPIDAVVHLGDYFYEYGPGGYGAEPARRLGRQHVPPRETVSLSDYRERHAQYKTDPQLQRLHAAAPWICTWDDHESTNDSYRTGAENHDPDEGEGLWSDRKRDAVQAYLEWMPVRDPAPERETGAIWRRFDFGGVASVMCLESRLTGRSESLSWAPIADPKVAAGGQMAMMGKAQEIFRASQDPQRTMLGPVQEEWLAEQLSDSAASGTSWQVLANQTIMARVVPANFAAALSEERKAAQQSDFIRQMIQFSQLGLPWNLDAWDGYPAARERLYAAAADAGARLVTLTGDTHTAWANTLKGPDGGVAGAELACTSVSSPGVGAYLTGVPEFAQLMTEANPEVEWHDAEGSGYTLAVLTPEAVEAEYVKVSTVEDRTYSAETVARFRAERSGDGMTPLSRTA